MDPPPEGRTGYYLAVPYASIFRAWKKKLPLVT